MIIGMIIVSHPIELMATLNLLGGLLAVSAMFVLLAGFAPPNLK